MKLLMDRMLPISVCDKNADIADIREKITININSVEIPEREDKGCLLMLKNKRLSVQP